MMDGPSNDDIDEASDMWVDPSEIKQDLKQMEEPPKDTPVDTFWFFAVTAFLVVLNFALLGAEADYGCYDKCPSVSDRLPWAVVDLLMAVLFTVEVSIRVKYHGLGKFFRGDPFVHKLGFDVLNSIDVLTTWLRSLDMLLGFAGVISYLKFITVIRIVCLFRVAGKLRHSPSFREVWLIASAFQQTIKIVIWVTLLLVIVLWVFAVILTIIVGHSDPHQFDYSHNGWRVGNYWGTVPRSMLSMFQVATLDKWSSVLVRPLVHKRPMIVCIFAIFMCIAVLALLNTIVGVIVESIITNSKTSQEELEKERQKTQAMVTESLHDLFKEADTNDDNQLSIEEVLEAYKEPRVADRLKLVDIPLQDLLDLFRLLNQQNPQTNNPQNLIPTDKFFRGCAKLHGPAMSQDLQHMSTDLTRTIRWACDANDRFYDCNQLLSKVLDAADTIDCDIVKGDADELDEVLTRRRNRARQNNLVVYADDSDFLRSISEGSRHPSKGTRQGSKKPILDATLRYAASMRFSGSLEGSLEDKAPAPPANIETSIRVWEKILQQSQADGQIVELPLPQPDSEIQAGRSSRSFSKDAVRRESSQRTGSKSTNKFQFTT